jgi:hypothetical protein
MHTDTVLSSPSTSSLSSRKPALVVFGTDDRGKPHASWFDEIEVDLATKAASLMGMQVLPVATEHHHALASKLPRGRLFASGKGFVPFVARATFEKLVACEGVQRPPAPLRDPEQASNGPCPEIRAAAGGRKGAGASLPVAGTDLNAAPMASAGVSASPASGNPERACTASQSGPEGNAGGGDPTGATAVADLGVGSTVLATEGHAEGWFESLVLKIDDQDVLTLKWRDYPRNPVFRRRRSQVALLPPENVGL